MPISESSAYNDAPGVISSSGSFGIRNNTGYISTGIVGGAPPQIANFSPTVGTALGAKQAVGFDITDDTGLKRGMVLVVLGQDEFVVHDGDTFRGQFSGTRTPIAGGFRFSVSRGGVGWTAAPTFRFLVTDTSGQEAV